MNNQKPGTKRFCYNALCIRHNRRLVSQCDMWRSCELDKCPILKNFDKRLTAVVDVHHRRILFELWAEDSLEKVLSDLEELDRRFGVNE
jgi:hypothetical protein